MWRWRLQNEIKELRLVLEELKQMIVAIAAKVRRYHENVDRIDKTECFRIIRRNFIGN